MREIKFRALCQTDKAVAMLYFTESTFDNGLWFDSPIDHINSYESPLMQYTGLKDKNGSEIYEGDRLNRKRHKESGNWASELIFDPDYEISVSFNNGMFTPEGMPTEPLFKYIKDNTYGATGTNWEIVGNIYEPDKT